MLFNNSKMIPSRYAADSITVGRPGLACRLSSAVYKTVVCPEVVKNVIGQKS